MFRQAGEMRSSPSAPTASVCSPPVFLVSPMGLQREGLKLILGRAGFLVRGEAEELDETRQISTGADLFLVDVGLANISTSCVRDLKMLRQRFPKSRIVLLDNNMTLRWFNICLETALDGYLSKQCPPSIFARRLELIAAGARLLPVELMTELAACSEPDASLSGDKEMAGLIRPTETKLLGYLVAGVTNKVIGRSLNIPEAVVKVRLRSICRKINVSNRTEAAIWAFKHGVGPPAPGERESASH